MNYYLMNIDDYATPGFCSADKPIIGTWNDFERLANEKKLSHNDNSLTELLLAYKANHNLEHEVAYHKDKLLKGVKLLDIRHVDKENYTWRHFNIWDFPYDFFAQSVEVERIMCSRYSKIYIASKITFNNIVIKSDQGNTPITHTWGYPGIYSFEDNFMKTTVYIVEKEFHKMEYFPALDYFNGDIDLTKAVEEILGDG